jgi:mannose-6-phosphate isomerase-like protein (cupin superfamily)
VAEPCGASCLHKRHVDPVRVAVLEAAEASDGNSSAVSQPRSGEVQHDWLTVPVTFETRPWGGYEVLSDAPTHKVKRLTVEPGQRLSYQRHFRRREHWVVIAGTALVVLDGKNIRLKPGESVDIPRGAWHRIGNPGKKLMTFIEVQQGDYFGEDDIKRSSDDYGRE